MVIAAVVDKNQYLTTTLDIFAFETIRLAGMGNALTFEEPYAPAETCLSITIARRTP